VSNDSNQGGFVRYLQEFSIPLIVGVLAALVAANLAPHWYHEWFGHWDPAHPPKALPGSIFGHHLTIHFLVNDIFMVFFFGVAAKEITEACLPGGSLNPPKKAVNPLIATIGGVAGPVAVFFGLMFLFRSMGMDGYDEKTPEEWSALVKGWGIPTATDIALAWLVARTVFGKLHPAVNFLLLLAVADDAIGLVIIALFYGDPAHPAAWEWLGLVGAGMAVAFALRRMNVQSWLPYVFVAGAISWCGLMKAHLHPALALVPIVPFLPAPRRDTGMFMAGDEIDVMGEETAKDLGMHHSPLENYEHQTKAFVDFGLFFFAMANAGVQVGGMGAMTWAVLGALVIGKTIGIAGLGLFAEMIGFPLPNGMSRKDLVMAAFIAALGLTVALFVAGAAFTDLDLQGEAKMGALLSGLVGIAAVVLGKVLGFGKPAER
jgi:NhaA family Na+:H+ antiporter